MELERVEARCVVIGAGFSGLAAAVKLHEAGIDTVVLEARDRVGGRAHSVRLEDGTVLDLGGQWFGTSHHRVAKWGEKYGAPTVLQRTQGIKTLQVRGKTVRFKGEIPFGLGPIALAALGIGLLRMERMARRLPPGQPWAAPKAREWDGQTLETWISRHVHSKAARAICCAAISGFAAADPSEISLLHGLFFSHVGETPKNLTEAIEAAQRSSFREGMQGMAERVARSLGKRVRLNHPVRRIRYDREGVHVEADGLEVEAARAIVAIPPALAGRLDYDPPLPGPRDHLTQQVPQGCAIKCIAIYDKPFWREAGHSGIVLDDQGPATLMIDASPEDVRCGIVIGFAGGSYARRAAQLPEEVRRREVLECFARSFGPAALTPKMYKDKNWSEEPFSRGCYAGHMPPGVWTNYGSALREPIGPIHWAGTETAGECMGLFEGALEAGERAADEVISATS